MGVVMRLPPGLTLHMLKNFYNSRKRQRNMYHPPPGGGNNNNSNWEYDPNAVQAEMNFRRGIIAASGLTTHQFVIYYHRYGNLREANQRRRKNNLVRRAAGKFKAGRSITALRPALRQQLGGFGNNYANLLKGPVYRNASPIRRR